MPPNSFDSFRFGMWLREVTNIIIVARIQNEARSRIEYSEGIVRDRNPDKFIINFIKIKVIL